MSKIFEFELALSIVIDKLEVASITNSSVIDHVKDAKILSLSFEKDTNKS
jgi:hypothetical protein